MSNEPEMVSQDELKKRSVAVLLEKQKTLGEFLKQHQMPPVGSPAWDAIKRQRVEQARKDGLL